MADIESVAAVPAIKINELHFSYPQKTIFTDFSATFPQGKHTVIVGSNGSGKSTLLALITGALKPKSGSIEFFSKQKLAFVPQETAITPMLPITVENTVAMGLWSELSWLKRPTVEQKKRVKETLELLQLSELAKAQLSEISGGQKQRALIAQALTQNSDILLLDEPVANLDQQSKKIVLELIKDLSQKKITVIQASHDNESIQAADFIIEL